MLSAGLRTPKPKQAKFEADADTGQPISQGRNLSGRNVKRGLISVTATCLNFGTMGIEYRLGSVRFRDTILTRPERVPVGSMTVFVHRDSNVDAPMHDA